MMNSSELIQIFSAMTRAIEQNKDHLCELDGAIGDADHGVTMSMGFKAVDAALAALDHQTASPTNIFNTAASSFLNAVGASAGPLYATAFMHAGKALKGVSSLNSKTFGDAIEAMAEGIQKRGKAEAGDKTMLDAWLPAAEASVAGKHRLPLNELLLAIKEAAEKGAQSTIGMQAKKGRSAKLGKRSVGHMDAGAASTAIILAAMAEAVAVQG